MKYSIETNDGKMKATIAVTADEWNGFIERAYQKNKGGISVQGFRKGHVPRGLIERMYGKEVFYDDAFDLCAQEHYTQILSENLELFPVETPKAAIEKRDQSGLSYTLEAALKPVPVLGKYKGIEVERTDYTVFAEEIDMEVEKSRQRLIRKTPREGAAENGDTVNLDYSGSVNGVKFEGGTAQNQELKLGSGSFIPGFEEQLVGINAGESRNVNVTFPEEYHSENLKGKAAVFACTVHKIFKNELPEIDDELAKELGFDSLKEYRADIEGKLRTNYDNRAKNESENKLVEAIVANAEITIPEGMIDVELDYMLEDFAYRLMYMYNGMRIEDYFKYTKTGPEEFKQAHRDEALRSVKTRLVLEKIIIEEKLEVTDADLEAEIAVQAEQAKKTAEEFSETLNEQSKAQMKNSLISKKVMDFLTQNNTFKTVKPAKSAAAKAAGGAAKKTTAATKTASTAKKTKTDAE